jgi:ABC-type antimicrobial peptide transport system permease subunit
MTVIGVVKETKSALSDGTVTPTVYVPVMQSVVADTVMVKGQRDAADLVKDVTRLIRDLNPAVFIIGSGTLSGAIDDIRQPRQMAASVLTTAALMGLLLASIGLYGLVAFSVAQRTREIGIRTALGARRGNIMRLVLADGVKVILIGSAIGLAGGAGIMRLASATIIAFPPMDVATFVAVPIVLAIVVLAASYVPARRAARIDPLVALREL